ncbi:MAG: hypothetical protein JNN04_01355 [Cyclobacteriaceae bacterium]|nr:hypothetical protein [Cyclobacteriaceae bacterium]
MKPLKLVHGLRFALLAGILLSACGKEELPANCRVDYTTYVEGPASYQSLYTYNDRNQIVSVEKTGPIRTVTQYFYNKDNLLEKTETIYPIYPGLPQEYVKRGFTYNKNGLLEAESTSLTFSGNFNSSTRTYHYNHRGRLTKVEHSEFSQASLIGKSEWVYIYPDSLSRNPSKMLLLFPNDSTKLTYLFSYEKEQLAGDQKSLLGYTDYLFNVENLVHEVKVRVGDDLPYVEASYQYSFDESGRLYQVRYGPGLIKSQTLHYSCP